MAGRRSFLRTMVTVTIGAIIGAVAVVTVGDNLRSASAADGVLELEAFDHIGFVVEDRDAVIELWSKLFGLGPWYTTEPTEGPMEKMAWVRVGATQFELLQPRMDVKSHWSDHFEKHGEGIHHVSVLADNAGDAMKRLVAAGAKYEPGTPYLNTEGHGDLILEVMPPGASALNRY